MNVLALCDQMGSGYFGLARLLGTGLLSSLIHFEILRGKRLASEPRCSRSHDGWRQIRRCLGCGGLYNRHETGQRACLGADHAAWRRGLPCESNQAKSPLEVVHLCSSAFVGDSPPQHNRKPRYQQFKCLGTSPLMASYTPTTGH